MKLTSESVLRDHYDVIVVGAGLGGITAAGLLAKRGLSVLLIDQQNKPGGACTSFKREDHVFDVGAAMLYGFGQQGFRPFYHVINELEEPIEVIAHSTLARMTFEGREIVFWPDVSRFLEELISIYPEEEKGLRAFYTDLYGMYEHIVIKNEVISPPSDLSPRQALRQLVSNPLAIFKMQRLLSTSTLDLMKKYFHSDEVIHFFDKLCSAYAYTTAAETPAVLAATMFIDNHVGGVYFPAGGAQMLPNVIEKAFERNGGQTLYRQRVDEILIENGKAYGVRLQNGTEIHAERVIANATVWNIYRKLVHSRHISPERLKWVDSLVPTFPSMTLYMVIDRKGLPANIFPWEIYIENRKIIDSTDLTLYINSLVDATLCPPDELVVMAIAPNMKKWPHADDPAYRSPAYEALKQREAGRMLDQIEQHIPGFRQHVHSLIIGTPTTIERYLLKNGGAVGGPKNQIGQEMLKRLHARSEWKNLYFCGDSTVMGTGAPAATVSGVGAANVILRELHLPEYEPRKFTSNHVHFVETPYRRPAYSPEDAITAGNAHLAAAHCQGCQEPDCVKDCPAGIDIPGFLRRMEAKNYVGAARLIREKNPFGEVCGLSCAANQLCQRRCYRRDFSGSPVRIAELQRWVCEQAGLQGWMEADRKDPGPEVAVIGGGPAALSCAYYLRLAGCSVRMFAREAQPGGKLWEKSAADPRLRSAAMHDIRGIMAGGIHFQTITGEVLQLEEILKTHKAVFLTDPGGKNTSDMLDTDIHASLPPGVFTGADFMMNGMSVVKAVSCGRDAAVEISRFLACQARLQSAPVLIMSP